MHSLPESIAALISALNKLPGIGPRSAERLALHLVKAEAGSVRQLAESILTARERIQTCQVCGALTEPQPCSLCDDPRRDSSLVCLVEQPVDIISIEKSGAYHGKYHVLGGKISPLNGVEPEDLRIGEVDQRAVAIGNGTADRQSAIRGNRIRLEQRHERSLLFEVRRRRQQALRAAPARHAERTWYGEDE